MDSLIKSHHAATTKKPAGRATPVTDDIILAKQIEATHSPDARDLEVKLVLGLVEDILRRATIQTDQDALKLMESAEDKIKQAHLTSILDDILYTIDLISCEIQYKSLSGSDGHESAIAILHLLAHYHWDAKLVLTLAAFALTYGEFWLLVQVHSSNMLAKSLSMLKLVPAFLEHTSKLRPKFDALNGLISEMLTGAKCVVQFRELPEAYISQDAPEIATVIAFIPTVVYWTIRGVIACSAQISMITTMGPEAPAEPYELSHLTLKLKHINEQLLERLRICNQYIEERKSIEEYELLVRFFQAAHSDNMRVLKALIYAKDDIPPLMDGSVRRRVKLEVLRRKSVVLFISDLDISKEELTVLEHIYSESKKSLMRPERDHIPYEVVWIPIVDPNVDYERSPHLQKKFEDLLATMPWYSVYTPKLMQKHVIRFIKEKWHFRNKPILVVLDHQGRVVSQNAIHMMWIWGTTAYPFTTMREEDLWRKETWKLELLVDGIDRTVLDWIREEKYIFLYGGDNMEWIRRFTKAAREAARDSVIQLEMVYVGKRNQSHREQIRRIRDEIVSDNLSYCWTDPAMTWFFWTRLESMLYSKIQLNQADDRDRVTSGIKKILSYDKVGNWAVLSKGAEIILTSHAAIMTSFEVYDTTWKKDVPPKGFHRALLDYHEAAIGQHGDPCSHFDFRVTAGSGRIPERMRCAECHRDMDKYITFSCCHEGKPGVTEEEGNL